MRGQGDGIYKIRAPQHHDTNDGNNGLQQQDRRFFPHKYADKEEYASDDDIVGKTHESQKIPPFFRKQDLT